MKKVGYFFFCFLPLLASFGLQFVAAFPCMGISALKIFLSNIFAGKKYGFDALMNMLYDSWMTQSFTMMVSAVFAFFGILLFGFWYSKQFHVSLQQSPKKFANPLLLLGIVLMVPALQLLSSLVTGITASLFPSSLEFYEKLMETAGFSNEPSFLLVLYAVILGPIEEELTFRGVIFSSAKKALPFWAANIFQAALFGLFHMNLIQGFYAFFIGLFLGFICEKGGSIYLSIFLHILFNSWGTFVPTDGALYTNPLYTGIFFVVAVLIGIVGLYLFSANRCGVKNVKESVSLSDI